MKFSIAALAGLVHADYTGYDPTYSDFYSYNTADGQLFTWSNTDHAWKADSNYYASATWYYTAPSDVPGADNSRSMEDWNSPSL